MITEYMKQRQAQKLEGPQRKPKKAYNIKAYSDKRAKLNREYAKKSRPYWKGKECAIRSPGCQNVATGIHHMKGKDTPELLMDEKYWLPACGYCNTIWLEEHDAEARKLGFKVSRLK